MKWLIQLGAVLLVLCSVLHSSQATFELIFNSLNSLFNGNDGLDTSDGRFERFNGPVRGLPEGHGGGRFGKQLDGARWVFSLT